MDDAHEIRTRNAIQFFEAGGVLTWAEWKLMTVEDKTALLSARDEMYGRAESLLNSVAVDDELVGCEDLAKRLVGI